MKRNPGTGAHRPERAPRQGREGEEPHQRRVRALCALCERVTERVRFRINSDEHDAKHGVRCEGEKQFSDIFFDHNALEN